MSNRAHHRRAARRPGRPAGASAVVLPVPDEAAMHRAADQYLAMTLEDAGPGGAASYGVCKVCGGLMFFAERTAGVRYFGSIIPGVGVCELHEDSPVEWAYNLGQVTWLDD